MKKRKGGKKETVDESTREERHGGRKSRGREKKNRAKGKSKREEEGLRKREGEGD
jgi:hypothetical protein